MCARVSYFQNIPMDLCPTNIEGVRPDLVQIERFLAQIDPFQTLCWDLAEDIKWAPAVKIE